MILINGVDYTKFAVFPIKTQYARDESLNQGVLTLKNMSIESPFEPMSVVVYNDERWLIGSDNVTKTRFGKSNKYQHDIILIEETKLLEKYFVDNCTFTNSLLESGVDIADAVSPDINRKMSYTNPPSFIENEFGFVSGYSTPLLIGSSFTFKRFSEVINIVNNQSCKTQVFKNGVSVYETDIREQRSDYLLTPYTTIVENAKYEIIYTAYIRGATGIGRYFEVYTVSYKFDTAEQHQTIREPYTITDVVNRILYLAEIQRKGNYPRFTFNTEQSVEYSLIDAPEML